MGVGYAIHLSISCYVYIGKSCGVTEASPPQEWDQKTLVGQ